MNIQTFFLLELPGGPELILILLVLVLLFGGRKIPELMKGLGEGMREFKKARNADEPVQPKKDDSVKS